MFDGLSTELLGATIYDLASLSLKKFAKNEWIQTQLVKFDLNSSNHDFAERYLETLVELRLAEKSKDILAFFREESIRDTFYVFYYGNLSQRGETFALNQALDHFIESLKVGEDLIAKNVDIEKEVHHFWQIFQQKVQESRTVKEVELIQKIESLKNQSQNQEEMLKNIQTWLKEKDEVEINGKKYSTQSSDFTNCLSQKAKEIFNFQNINTAHFHFKSIAPKPKQLNNIPIILPTKVIGRDTDTENIYKRLHEDHALLLVNGIGGVGKTIASVFYQERYSDHYSHIMYVKGEGDFEKNLIEDTILHRRLGIEKEIKPYLDGMKMGERENNIKLAKDVIMQQLETLPKICLILVDNATSENIRLIEKEKTNLPNFHFLITSRQTGNSIPCYPLNCMNETDAVKLFYSYYSPNDEKPHNDAAVKKIVAFAGNHTLTIELLAKILRNHRRLTIESLQEKVELNPIYLNLNTDVTIDTPYGSKKNHVTEDYINNILEFCFDLSEIEVDSYTESLLQTFSILPTRNIVGKDLEKILGITDKNEAKYLKSLNDLIDNGWIQERKESDYLYDCHAIIQTVVRKKLNVNTETCKLFIISLIKEIDKANRTNPLEGKKWIPYAESILHHIEDTEIKALLISNLSHIYKVLLGDYQKALNYGLHALEIIKKIPSFEITNLATLYSRISCFYQDIYNLDKSKEYGIKALDIRLKELPPDHIDLADSYGNLAFLYENLGDTFKSLDYAIRAIRILEKDGANSYRTLANAYNIIANTYRAKKDLKNSLAYLLKSKDVREIISPPMPIDLATIYCNIGIVYQELSDTDKAFEYQVKALDIRKKIFPSNHDSLANSYHNLAITYSSRKEWEKALTSEQEALIILLKKYPLYPITKISVNTMEKILYNAILMEGEAKYQDIIIWLEPIWLEYQKQQ